MSVAQIKKQFDELAAYLGKDASGLKKLRELKEPVNSLRTRLASSEDARERAEALARRLAGEMLKVNAELDAMKEEAHSLRQRAANLTRDLAAATASPAEEDSDEYAPDLTEHQRGYREAIRRLRHVLPTCPKPKRRLRPKEMDWNALPYYSRESFAAGWTHNDLWVLGASVAVLAALEGIVAITAEQRLRDGLEPIADTPEKEPAKKRSQTLTWFRNVIDFDSGLTKGIKEAYAMTTPGAIDRTNQMPAPPR